MRRTASHATIGYMAHWFEDRTVADGYATARPPIHRPILERALRLLPQGYRRRVGVDVGCGGGGSTGPLARIVDVAIGIDPSAAMVGAARDTNRCQLLLRSRRGSPIARFIRRSDHRGRLVRFRRPPSGSSRSGPRPCPGWKRLCVRLRRSETAPVLRRPGPVVRDVL